MSEFVIKSHSKTRKTSRFYTLHLYDGIHHQLLGRFKTRSKARAAEKKYLERL